MEHRRTVALLLGAVGALLLSVLALLGPAAGGPSAGAGDPTVQRLGDRSDAALVARVRVGLTDERPRVRTPGDGAALLAIVAAAAAALVLGRGTPLEVAGGLLGPVQAARRPTTRGPPARPPATS